MHTALMIEEDAIGLAEQDGVLSAQEAFALEELSEREEPVPEELFDAVERLFLYLCADNNTIH